jgi:uncharacterized protein (TIGR00369 family)
VSIPTVEEVNSFLSTDVPFCAAMNISCHELSTDVGVMRFDYDPRWIRPGSIVSGPVLVALADVAVYVAIFTRVGIVPLAVTNELKINFLRPAIGHDVLARARLHKLGRRIAYASVDLTEEQDPDRLVAQATASYVLPEDSNRL